MADAFQSAWVEVLPDFQEFRGKANREMSGILGSAGDEGGRRAGKGVGAGIIGGIGGAATGILGAFAALGIANVVGDAVSAGVRFGFEGIDLASDLAETRSAVDQVFGEASKSIQSFAANANTNLGQTQQQALAAAQTFGIFGQSAGLAGDDLSGFTTDLVGLSADFASFYNATPQEAIDAIGAGLRGEAEPLRRFGILLDDATLKAKALELGIFDGNGSLTQQQKILAAQASIFAQSSVAQGDFERTSGGLANQQRILAASFEEAQTKLGTALLPALTGLVTFLNTEGVPILNDIISKVGPQLGDALIKSAPAFSELLMAVVPLIPALIDLGVQALPPILEFLVAVTPFIIEFITQMTRVQAATDSLFSFLAGDTTLDQFRGKISGLTGPLFSTANAIGAFVGTNAVNLARFAADYGTNIAKAGMFISSLPGVAASALGNIGNILVERGRALIQGFIDGMRQMIKPVTDVVSGIMSSVKGFFPNSPAKTGPFSGSGWTGLFRSGEALFNQFNAGFGVGELSMPGVPSGVLAAGRLSASFGAATQTSAADRPIYMENGALFGVIREVANGEAQLVVNSKARDNRRILTDGKRDI